MLRVDPTQLAGIEPLSDNDKKDVLETFAKAVTSGQHSVTDAFSLVTKLDIDLEDAFSAAFGEMLKNEPRSDQAASQDIPWARLSLAVTNTRIFEKGSAVHDYELSGTDKERPAFFNGLTEKELASREFAKALHRDNVHAIPHVGRFSFRYCGVDKNLYGDEGHHMMVNFNSDDGHELTWTMGIADTHIQKQINDLMPVLHQTGPQIRAVLKNMADNPGAAKDWHDRLMPLLAQREVVVEEEKQLGTIPNTYFADADGALDRDAPIGKAHEVNDVSWADRFLGSIGRKSARKSLNAPAGQPARKFSFFGLLRQQSPA